MSVLVSAGDGLSLWGIHRYDYTPDALGDNWHIVTRCLRGNKLGMDRSSIERRAADPLRTTLIAKSRSMAQAHSRSLFFPLT
jgi:hypothetical protein